MIKEITEIFSRHAESVLREASARYGLKSSELEKLGSFENFVYKAPAPKLILRITHSLRRTPEALLGELEFIRYLVAHGVPAAAPVPSLCGDWVNTVDCPQGHFLVTAFQQAEGAEPDVRDLTSAFFVNWGRLTGRIHAVTKTFRPSHPAFKRQAWYQEEVLDFEKYVPASQSRVHEQKEKLFKWMHQLPKDQDSYGLIHNDIHYGNIYLAGGRLTLFDFDDCTYSWFVNDIAIALHSILPGYDRESEFEAIARGFITGFMKGYHQENCLDPFWLRLLQDFLRFYDLVDYGIIYQAWDMDHLTPRQQEVSSRVRKRIETETPLVRLDSKVCGR